MPCLPACLAALIAALALFAHAPRPALAHPHVWIEAAVELHFDGDAVTELEIDWAFDPFFSMTLLEDFDLDGDGRFDDYETGLMLDQVGPNLAILNWFTHAEIGFDQLKVEEVENFRAVERDGAVHFRFTIPLPQPVNPRKERFVLGLFDQTFFVAFRIRDDDGVDMTGAPQGCRALQDVSTGPMTEWGAVIYDSVEVLCG